MSYYRITVYDWQSNKDVLVEDSDDDIIITEAETAMQDLFKGSIKSIVISKITGKAGIRDDF